MSLIIHNRRNIRIRNHILSLCITPSCGRALVSCWKEHGVLHDGEERFCEIRFSRRLFLQIVIYDRRETE